MSGTKVFTLVLGIVFLFASIAAFAFGQTSGTGLLFGGGLGLLVISALSK